MFVKFTRKDGAPVWLNANYVVTVEPLRTGGTLVVPVGDGIDYEVREEPQAVIEAVESAQSHAAPVPVQNREPSARKRTSKSQAAAKAEPAAVKAEPAATPKAEVARPGQAKAADVAETPKFEPAEGAEGSAEEAMVNSAAAAIAIKKELEKTAAKAAAKTAKTTRRPRKTKAEKEAEAAAAAKENAPAQEQVQEPEAATPAAMAVEPARAVQPLDLDDEEISRLRTMAPRNIRKTINTLKAQFDVADPDATVRAMEAAGVISIDAAGRIAWNRTQPTMPGMQ